VSLRGDLSHIISRGGGSSLHSGIEFGRSKTVGVFGGEEVGGGVRTIRSRPGAARTILR
jgi:hypothetical protein